MKPKKKPSGLRSLDKLVKETTLEHNIKNEVAKEIKPNIKNK